MGKLREYIYDPKHTYTHHTHICATDSKIYEKNIPLAIKKNANKSVLRYHPTLVRMSINKLIK